MQALEHVVRGDGTGRWTGERHLLFNCCYGTGSWRTEAGFRARGTGRGKGQGGGGAERHLSRSSIFSGHMHPSSSTVIRSSTVHIVMRSSYLGCVVKTAKFTCLALPAVQEFVQNKKHCKNAYKCANEG